MAGGLGMTHGDFAGRMRQAVGQVVCGECIGENYPDAESAVQGWINSAPHRAILLGRFDRAGVGMAVSSAGTKFWALDVASGGD